MYSYIGWLRSPLILVILMYFTGCNASPYGHFDYTGSTQGTGEHDAVLLKDGHVLIAYHWRGERSQQADEIYAPVTGKFTLRTSPPIHQHFFESVLPLGNDLLLVAGGVGTPIVPSKKYSTTDVPLDRLEVYSLLTGRIIKKSKLICPRESPSMVLLKNGTVLISGGDVLSNQNTEIYDPVTNTSRQIQDMRVSRWEHTSTLLPDGTVLIAGGSNSKQAELFDPKTEKFTLIGEMFERRAEHDAILLKNGKVLLLRGGVGCASNVLQSAELYDPRLKKFTQLIKTLEPKSHVTNTLLKNGFVLSAGGADPSNATYLLPFTHVFHPYALKATELFNPQTNRFIPGPKMKRGRVTHSATLLKNGKVLITGFSKPFLPILSSTVAEIYTTND